jgi:hypothetical protein
LIEPTIDGKKSKSLLIRLARIAAQNAAHFSRIIDCMDFDARIFLVLGHTEAANAKRDNQADIVRQTRRTKGRSGQPTRNGPRRRIALNYLDGCAVALPQAKELDKRNDLCRWRRDC